MKHGLIGAWAMLLAMGAAADPTAVRGVAWERFDGQVNSDADLEAGGRVLLNAARYGLAWAEETFDEDTDRSLYRIPNENQEHHIRPPASAAWGLAVVLKTGLFDEARVGVSREEALDRTVKLVKGVATVHKAVPDGRWGDHWQSSLWAGLAGGAGWLLREDLDDEARDAVRRMVVYEADRFIRPDYQVPYWNGEGGDTKAEENAWNSMVLALAVTMLPEHPHVSQWKEVCSELMISAYARPSDTERTDITVDGRTPKDWLEGYNAREDGVVINHNIVHNDYMTCVGLSHRATLLCSLAGIPAPEAADYNFDVAYRAMVTLEFASPPYKAPGGTMYIPGRPEQYYPQGTDWSVHRFATFYLMDTAAHRCGYDRGLPHRAASWMRLRAARIEEMQARHDDGRMFADGEFDRYPGREPMVLWFLADAYLYHWLHAHDALAPQANWLE